MKRIFSLLVLICFLFSLCSCSKTPEHKEAESQNSILQTIGEDETYIQFLDQDFSQWTFTEDTTAEGPELPETYSELLQLIGPNGVIVAGRAEGIRKGDKTALSTLTTFRIEQVFHGKVANETIEISERYFPVETENSNHIFYYGSWYTMLKNDEPVLLFLHPRSTENQYYSCYFQLPLPEDYADFSSEDLTALLDYYRNDRTKMKTAPSDTTAPQTVQNDDGSYSIEYSFGAPVTRLEKTDQEMLQLMDDHILVQIASRFKIKIWPQNHVNYSGSASFFGDKGIKAPWTPSSK